MSNVLDQITQNAGFEYGIFYTEPSNLPGEIVVWCNKPSLPSKLQQLIKDKKIEIRDYQIITGVKNTFGFAVKLWICEYGKRIPR